MIRYAIIFAVLASPAAAQLQKIAIPHFCGPMASMRDMLAGKFKEKVAGYGFANNGKNVVEVYRSEVGGFTILETNEHGISCMMTSGEGFEPLAVTWDEPS